MSLTGTNLVSDSSRATPAGQARATHRSSNAEVAHPDDFIVGLVSLLIAQLSEEPALAEVFADLFDADGTDVVLRPLSEIAPAPTPLTFEDLVTAAARRGETAIGWRLCPAGGKPARVELNPERGVGRQGEAIDSVIVLVH